MPIDRYIITDRPWLLMEPHCLGKKSDPGRTGGDARLFLEGVLWIARTGAQWRDLPGEFGKWMSSVKQTIRGIVCSADGLPAVQGLGSTGGFRAYFQCVVRRARHGDGDDRCERASAIGPSAPAQDREGSPPWTGLKRGEAGPSRQWRGVSLPQESQATGKSKGGWTTKFWR